MDNTSAFNMQRVEVNGDGGITPVKRVIQNVATARQIYTTLWTDHLQRIYLYAEIDGMIAGNPPYNVEDLAKNGLLHIANFNTLEPRSLYEKNAQSYWNLLFTSESIIDFCLTFDDPLAPRFASTMSRHWNDIIRTGWGSFDTNYSVLTAQLVKYGISPLVWNSKKSPFWRVVEANRFFVPNQSPSDIDLLNTVCIENDLPIVFLLELYEKFKKTPDETPWQLDNLSKFLAWRANYPGNREVPNPQDLVQMQRKLLNGDVFYDNLYGETVRIVNLFYKEGNGKITHFMFHKDWSSQWPFEDGFLYIDADSIEDFRKVFLLFTQSPGEQYIHSNRGLGHKIFALCQAKMMMDNSLVDGGRWASTPIIKSPSMTVKEAEQIKFIPGVAMNIGPMEFQQNNLGANLQGIINTSQYLSSILDKNAAFSGDDSGKPDSSYGSMAPEVFRFNAYKEFNVLRNEISHFQSNSDNLLCEMHRRLCNTNAKDEGYELYKKWELACQEDGVPIEVLKGRNGELPKNVKVKAARTAGAGSQVGSLIGLKEVEPLVGTFSKEGQVNWIQDKIKVAMGYEFVSRYTKGMDSPDEMGGGASLAQIENNDMQNGQPALAEPANDNQVHITVHMQLGTGIVQGVVQGQLDAVQADRIFAQVIPHIAKHMEFLKGSIFARSFLEGIKKDWYDLQKFANLNRKNAERQLQAEAEKQEQLAQKQQEAMSDIQRKDMVAAADIQRKNVESVQKEERADKADERRGESLRKKTDAEIEAIRKKADAQSGNPSLEETNPRERLGEILNESKGTVNPFDFA